MSKLAPTKLERLALLAHCPQCDADPGVWCIAPHRGSANRLHTKRSRPVATAYHQGAMDAMKAKNPRTH